MSQLVKSSIILTFFTVCGAAHTFASYSLIAAKFGSGQEMDVYFTANVIPLFYWDPIQRFKLCSGLGVDYRVNEAL